MLATFGPIDSEPVTFPISPAKPDQTLVLTVDFTTTDPNDPIEGEPLILQPSAGDPITIRNYGTQNVSIPITTTDETLTAYVSGGDGDEQATITTGPTVSIVDASTDDSKSMTVSYDVEGNDGSGSLPIDVYRSSSDTPGVGDQVAIAQLTIDGTNATNGIHTIEIDPDGTTGAAFTFEQAQALRPDPTHRYVVTTADDQGTFDPADETSPPYSSFRIWLVGAVAHGLDGDGWSPTSPSYFPAPYLNWVDTMASQLQTSDGYDVGIPFHWEKQSVSKQTDQTVIAGASLALDVEQTATVLAYELGPNDVIDVNFIGYSRGAVVVSRALQELDSTTIPALKAGFMMETLVDPHPANNDIPPSNPTPQDSLSLSGLAAEFLFSSYSSFQDTAQDPNVVIPPNVQAAVDFYQHTSVSDLNPVYLNDNYETILNLWGEVPTAITNDSTTTILSDDWTGGYGHGEMMYNPVLGWGVGPTGFYESRVLLRNQTLQALGLKPFVGSSPGDPIVVTTQPPANITAGVPFGMVVTAENADGSVNTSYNGVVSLTNFGYGPLGGKTSVAAVNGVAIFAGLTLTQAGSFDILDVNATGQTGVDTNYFNVAPAAATKLAVVLPYSTPEAGSRFSLSVDAVDPYGNTDPSYNGLVTIALATNSGGATLGGTLTATAVNGVATFTNVTVTAPGVGYTITATAPGLAAGVSASLTVQDNLIVTTQPPASVTAGVPFGLVATVEDANGNANTAFIGPVTVAASLFFSSPVTGTLTVNAVNGVATFTNLILKTVSTFDQLTVSATGVQSVGTNDISVVAAPASQLVATSLPGVVVVGSPIEIVFDAEDPFGNLDTSYNGSVALALAANPGAAALGGTVTTTAVKGVATFGGVTVSARGVGDTVQATAPGLESGASPTFTAEDELVVTTQPPTSVIAGAPLIVAVSVEDGHGNLITSYNGAVTVVDNDYYALGGTRTVNAVNGLATFTGLTLATTTSYDTLGFTAAGIVSANSRSFSVAAATPTQLVVAPPGGPYIAGAPITFRVYAEDANGNIATSYSGSEMLSLASNPGGASLGGTLTVNAVNGIATFSGVTIGAAGVGYKVEATASGLTAIASSAFSVEDELVVTTQPPSPVTAGAPFTVTITVEDGTGKVITSYNGPVTVEDYYFNTLGGETTVEAVNGVATFTGLTLASPTTTAALSFVAAGLQEVTSKTFGVVVGTATQLAVVAPGGPFLVGAPITIAVDVEDSSGNLVPSYTGSVTLALATNPGGSSLGGTLTVNAAKGVATFAGLTLNAPGMGYIVKSTAAGLTSGVSTVFNLEDQLVVATQPPVAVFSDVPFTVAAAVEDGLGQIITSYNGPVTIADVGGYMLGGITTVNAVNGVATFSGLILSSVVNSTQLTLTASGLQEATTNTLGVAAAVATKLVVLPPGGSYLAGSPFKLVIEAEDAAGNVSTTFGGSVSLALGSDPGGASLGGTVTVSAVDGVATFSGVTVSQPGVGYTFQATASGLSAGASSAFTVQDRLVITKQPTGTIAAGAPFTVAVAVEDAAGNVGDSFNGLVTIADASGASLGGPRAVYAVNGVATFSGLSLTAAGPRSLVVNAQGVQGGQTGTLAITAAEVTGLAVMPSAGPYLVGTPIRVVVEAEDAYGNLTTSYGGTVSLALAANPGSATLGGAATAVASGGVATFTGVTVGAPGAGDTFRATASGLTSGVSSPFDVQDQLVITNQPPSLITAGVGFTVVASVEGGLGNVDTSYNGPVTIEDTRGYRLGGTTTVDAIDGIATFAGLMLTKVSGSDALSLGAPKMQGVSTNALAVTAAPASALTISVPYGPFLVGAPFGVTVRATDPYGNVATSYGGNVTLALSANPGSATLGGTVTATALNGLATFGGVSIGTPGVGYVLKATAPGLTAAASPAFTVEDQIVITTKPSGPVTAGSTFAIVATIEDGLGNTIPSFAGAVTLIDSQAGELSGTTSVNAVKGVATFSGLGSTFAATHDLTVRETGLRSATAAVVVSPGAATQLEIEGPYGSGPSNLVPTPLSLEVDAEDAYGNLVTGFNGNVTLALSADPTGATLGGTLTLAAVDGVAAFNGLKVDKPGSGYVLSASSPGLTKGFSPPFSRTDALVVSTPPPSTIVAGASFGLEVEAQASAGVLDTSYDGTVTISLNSYAGGFLNAIHGVFTAQAINGIAIFSGLTITQSDFDGFDIAATGLADAYVNFNVISATASQLVITSSPPSPLTAGAPFGLTVVAEDAYGNPTPGYFGTVTLTLAGGTAGATLGGTLSAAISRGVATFTGLTVNTAGPSYAIAAQTGGLGGVMTPTFAVTPTGTGTHLVVSAGPPASIPAGAPFGLVVEVEDDLGTVDGTFNGPVTLGDDSGNALGGSVTLNAVDGVATFSGLSLRQDNATDALTASAPGLTSATTKPFAIVSAAASRLGVSAPTGARALVNAAFSLIVDAEDASGNIDPNYNGVVTLSLANNPSSAKLGGTLTATAVDGVATFSGLTIGAAGTGFALGASAAGLTAGTSPGFDVTRDDLVVSTQPPGASAGATFGLAVSAEGGSGAVDPTFNGPVTLTLVNDTGGVPKVGGNLVVNAVYGVATLAGLTISRGGTYAFVASSAGLAGTTTNPFTIAGLPTSQLVVTIPPPADVTAGAPFALDVAAEDALGNLDSSYNGTITLTLTGGASGAKLGGTISAVAVDGVATFTGITASAPGTGYTLSATAPGLTAATSPAFSVSPVGAATQLVVTTEPPASVASDAPFSLTVTAEDVFGDIDASFRGPVTLSLGANPTGGSLAGLVSVEAVNGVAAFTGLTLLAPGSYAIAAGGGGLVAATTDDVAVTPPAATHLVVDGPGSTLVAGAPFGLEVDAENALGQVDPSFNGSVTLSLHNGPGGQFGGILTATAVAGVATFAGLTLGQAGDGDTIEATAAPLTPGRSQPFDVDNDHLVVTTPPAAGLTVGAAFGLTVSVETASGAVDKSFSGTVDVAYNALSSTARPLEGVLAVTAVEGVATFSRLSLSLAGLDDLIISADTVAGTSILVEASSAPASQLAVTAPPPPSVSTGAPFAIEVSAEDAQGNVDTTYTGAVTLSLAGGTAGAVLGGTVSTVAIDGVATFSALSLGVAGTGFTVKAVSGPLTAATTPAFRVAPLGTATELVVTSQPASVAAGATFTVVVQAEDSHGTVDTGFNGAVTIADGDGNSMSGTTAVNAVNGVATFNPVSLGRAVGNDDLVATAAGLVPAASSSFGVTAVPATRLVVVPPADVLAGSPFSLTVEAEDASGNVDPTYDGAVTISLASSPRGASLGGSLTASAVDGLATFDGLVLAVAGSGYAIAASGGGLAAGASTAFSATRDGLVVSAQPSALTAGAAFGLAVTAEDASGAVDASFTGVVSVALLDLDGGTAALGGTPTATAVGGVATFSGLSINRGGTFALVATGDQVGGSTTEPIEVVATSTVSAVATVSGTGTYGGTATLLATLLAADDSPLAGEPITFTLTAGGTVTAVGFATTNDRGVATLTGVSLAGLDAGVLSGSVGASFAGDAIDAPSTQAGNLTISPAPATLALGGLAATYDSAPQAATVISLPAGLAGLTVTYTRDGQPVAVPKAAGSYSVTATLTNPDYAASPATGTLVIGQATPTITWSDPAGITYGTPLGPTQLDATATFGGVLVPGTFTYTPALGTVLNAGQGQALAVRFTPSDAADFQDDAASVLINVRPAPLAVKVDGASKIYGRPNPAFTSTYSGFVLGQGAGALGGTLRFTTPATAGSHVGSYAITPAGLTSSNYAILFAGGTLTVDKAHLTVTAINASRPRGLANPPLAYALKGFVNGDTVAAVRGRPALSTTATRTSPAGSYPIRVAAGTLAATNYDFATLVGGRMTVTPAAKGAVWITPRIAAPVYGQLETFTAAISQGGAGSPMPTGTVRFQVDGVALGKPVKLVNGVATSVATAAIKAGSHTIAAIYSGDRSYPGGTGRLRLVVAKAPLTITAVSKVMVRGAAVPTLTYTVKGFVDGDTTRSFTRAPKLTTTATRSSPVGTYPITASGADDPNYAITYVKGTMKVTPTRAKVAISEAVPSDLVRTASVGTVTARPDSIGSTTPGSATAAAADPGGLDVVLDAFDAALGDPDLFRPIRPHQGPR